MDNLSVPKVRGAPVEGKDGAAGGQGAREALDDTVTAALAAITPGDARGWFHHCGYTAC